MAVDDFLSRDTDSFVLPSKAYYPLKIPIAHYQLRHFISSPEQDLIYYASGCDVYCLNAATRTQARVTQLPWEARCTASGHGYVCVGGEKEGNFAAIKVGGFPPGNSADVDALLPLDLSSRTALPRPPPLNTAHRVRLEKIGEDIVNSISIYKFPAEGDGEDDVVAVLTNNDKTVRIYSLTQELEIAVLDLPFAMNHATISPDGEYLLAVGDHPHCFFFERVKKQRPSTLKTPEGRIQSFPPEWSLFEEVHLYTPRGAIAEGYFTTAWSPSGRRCAVGSECGYITVFDMDMLKRCEYGEDAIIQLISSSRPDTHTGPGAVRTMQFSPAPWDFLIWSEDQARVCVADLRRGMKVKQILTLDPREESLEKVEIADFDLEISPELRDLRREADFIRRYRRALDSEGTAAAVNFATDYIEASSERRRMNRQLGIVESDDDPHGLTAHERQVLEALRTTRQREEGRETDIRPRSIHYNNPRSRDDLQYESTSSDLFPSLRSNTLRRAAELEARTNAIRRHMESEITRTREAREAASRRNMAETLTEFISESTRQLNELQDRISPRRRASVIISSEGSDFTAAQAGSSNNAGNGNTTDGLTTRSPNPIAAQPRRTQPDPQIISSTDDAWRTIEEALVRNARAADNVRTAAPELRTELRRLRQLTQMRERLRSAREAQSSLGSGSSVEPYSLSGLSNTYLGNRRSSRTFDPSQGVRTAGLAMSQDGRTLYCGTEEGIFEFKINLHERKGFPAVTPR